MHDLPMYQQILLCILVPVIGIGLLAWACSAPPEEDHKLQAILNQTTN